MHACNILLYYCQLYGAAGCLLFRGILEKRSGLSELSVTLWVLAIEGCLWGSTVQGLGKGTQILHSYRIILSRDCSAFV